MKITSFQLTIQQGVDNNGYADNYYLSIDEKGATNVSHPYKTMSYKEQAAILGIIQSAIVKYGMLTIECDRANQALKLEKYAESPEAISEEEKAIVAAKLSAAQELELAVRSASPQSCALGDGEVSTGADGDIDESKPKVETVIATVRGLSNEGLTVIGEE